LGQTVAVAGKLGADIQGDFVMSELRKRGVDITYIRRTANCATSGTVVINVTGEDRRYLHCIGANAEFRFDDLDMGALDGARLLYFGGYLALPSFNALVLARLMREAKVRDLTTVLDVTMPAGEAFGMESVAPVLRYTDYFLPNQEEAARLTGESQEHNQARRLGDLNSDCTVIITRGRRGPLARRRGRFIDAQPFPMDSVDESGAGDAFSAGLIVGLLNDWDLEAALSFASAIGASSTRALGCFESVFTFSEALAFLERQRSTLPGWDTFLRAARQPA
jgi:sugar/nucleoside kinase (ribokinase family)